MKHQALFSSKDKSRKIKESSAAILLGALRVNIHACTITLSLTNNYIQVTECDRVYSHVLSHFYKGKLLLGLPVYKMRCTAMV